MKSVLIAILMGMILVAPLALADQVNMNITVNGEANLNITVDADDTLARQMISEMQGDAYGTMTGSGPKDMILDEIEAGVGNPIATTEGVDTIYQLCDDPFLKQYLGSIGSLPPLAFVDYVKALGYDDEAHINMIWTICQQKYIGEQESMWSADTGVKLPDMVRYIVGAAEWLLGRDVNAPDSYKKIGTALDSYFASDKDVWILVNKIKELEIRIKTLESTMDVIAADPYCDAKLESMMQYDLSYVRCGNETFAKVDPEELGYDVIGYSTENQCTEDWVCTEWSECNGGKMERTCADINKCGTEEYRPDEAQACVVMEKVVEKEDDQPTFSYKQVSDLISDVQGFIFPMFIV